MKWKNKKNDIIINDEERFKIYQIYEDVAYQAKAKGFTTSQVCSPFYGSNVTNKNVYIDNKGKMDVDYAYDYIRKPSDKKITEERLIKEKGDKYYEFNILNNDKINKYYGNTKGQEVEEKKPQVVVDVTPDNLIFESFLSNIDDVEAEVTKPAVEPVVSEEDNDSLTIRIQGADNEDAYEYNSYSKNMPAPESVSIPSFLTSKQTNSGKESNLTFQEDEIKFDDIPSMQAPTLTFDDYSNPAVDKNMSIKDAILKNKENIDNGVYEDLEIKNTEVNKRLQSEYDKINEENKAKEEATPHVSINNTVINKPQIEEPEEETVEETPVVKAKSYEGYKIPYTEIFNKSSAVELETPAYIEENKEKINSTLKSFSIDGEVISYTKGPAFTLYEIYLAPGVNVKKVSQINDTIQMVLQATSIRMLCPIPGKPTVGIEVPNKEVETVPFGDLLSDEFINDGKHLNVCMGKKIDGSIVYQDISSMPHALIAGATQSGKSVSINTILISLITKNSPEHVKLLLVDPKKVEFSFYEDIPHLLTPVITDPFEATEALKWACEEMDRRYLVFQKAKARKITDYYKKRLVNPALEPMPYIVIVVDEFNDLIMQCSQEVNDCIVRLAQKARACGMHIILATQRPTVDVVSGVIKANIPCRISFRVASANNSLTILDEAGAENLLGFGDMLFKNNGPATRAQGAYVSDDEITAVCEYLIDKYGTDYLFSNEDLKNKLKASIGVAASGVSGGPQAKTPSDIADEYLYAVAKFCLESEGCSINSISQNFKMGFNKAQRVVALLEERGIVSPKNGTNKREILVDMYQLNQLFEIEGEFDE